MWEIYELIFLDGCCDLLCLNGTPISKIISDKWISFRIWFNCSATDWSSCVGSFLDGPFSINYIGTNQLSLLHTTSYEVMSRGSFLDETKSLESW